MSLEYWFPLTSDLHNQGISSLANASVQSGCSLSSDGKLGGCYKNTGTNACIRISAPLSADQFTLAAWVRIDTKTNSWNRAFGMSGSDSYMGMVTEHTNGTVVGFHYFKTISGSNTSVFDSYPCSPTVGVWYHYAMSYDGTKYYIYQNGSLVKSANASKTNIRAEMDYLYLFGYSGGYSKDSMNDVRIYSHCLSAKEVEILARGLVLHYPMTGGRGCDNLLKYTAVNTTNQNLLGNSINSAWKNLPLTTIDGFACYNYPKSYSSTGFYSGQWLTGMLANTTYTYSAWLYFTSDIAFNFQSLGHFQVYNSNSTASDKSHEDVVSARIYEPSTIKANTWTKVRITFTTNNLAGSYFTVYPRYNVAANIGELYFRDCKLELSDHSTPWIPNSIDNEYSSMGYNNGLEYDVSGYLHNGTINGSVSYSGDSARYSVSTSFVNGSYISTTVPIPSSNGSIYTFAWWGKITSISGTMMWGFANGNRLNLYIVSGNSNCYWNTGDGNNNPFGVNPSTFGDGTWHHFAITGDGTTTKLYIDGTFKANAKTFRAITGTTLIFNGWNTNNDYNFNGNLSDFRLYATCLSAEDIQKLYNKLL